MRVTSDNFSVVKKINNCNHEQKNESMYEWDNK